MHPDNKSSREVFFSFFGFFFEVYTPSRPGPIEAPAKGITYRSGGGGGVIQTAKRSVDIQQYPQITEISIVVPVRSPVRFPACNVHKTRHKVG